MQWHDAFWAIMHDAADKPFVWGEHDCVSLAARVYECVTGEKPDLHGFVWTDEASARAILERYGGIGVMAEVNLGTPTAVARCQMGDIVLARDPDGVEYLGVHDGTQVVGAGLRGLRKFPWPWCVHGWRLS